MPIISFTFTYMHPYEKQEETTSITGKCDFDSTLLTQLKEIASKLQTALNNQQLTAMKLGNNFLISNAQDGNEYIPITIDRLLVNSKHATSAMNKIDTLITRIHQCRTTYNQPNRFFQPIKHGENHSTPTPPLRA